MSKLKVSYIQADLIWENPIANIKLFTDEIEKVPEGTDLIILPEMFSTGFSMKPEKLAEKEDGPSLSWMKEMAQNRNCVVTGSLIIESENQYFNRLFWVLPNGEYQTYDKRHLFSLANEQNFYSAGNKSLIIDLKGFKIMPLICYDLRFPVWSRNTHDYDVLIYVANWPERRSYFWKQLLIARAIENQSYVIGVNRVGNDGNDVFHSGDSICLDPLGQPVVQSRSGKSEVVNFTLSKDSVKRVREKFQFLNDKDDFRIIT